MSDEDVYENLCRSGISENDALREKLENVASMCRRMSYALKRSGSNDKLIAQCVDLLKRYDLGGNVMREMNADEALSASSPATMAKGATAAVTPQNSPKPRFTLRTAPAQLTPVPQYVSIAKRRCSDR